MTASFMHSQTWGVLMSHLPVFGHKSVRCHRGAVLYLSVMLLALPGGCATASSDSRPEAAETDVAHEPLYVANRGGLWGFIDRSGEFVIPPTYPDRPGDFSEGLARIQVDGKFGFIDPEGQIVIEPTLDAAEPFSDGLSAATLGHYNGYVDRQGEWRLRGRFRRVRPFHNGLAPVVDANNRHQLIDREGVNALPTSYQNLKWAGTWPVVVRHDREWYFVGRGGGRALGGTFKLMEPSPEGITIASPNKKTWRFLNADRETLFEVQAKRVLAVSNSAAAVHQDGRWHFVDMTGQPIGDQGFKKIVEPGFVEGMAGVFDDQGKLGYIDKTGASAIAHRFDDGEPFRDGLAVVQSEGEWVYINRDGEVVWPKPTENETDATAGDRDDISAPAGRDQK